jgi:hypothetical protein
MNKILPQRNKILFYIVLFLILGNSYCAAQGILNHNLFPILFNGGVAILLMFDTYLYIAAFIITMKME